MYTTLKREFTPTHLRFISRTLANSSDPDEMPQIAVPREDRHGKPRSDIFENVTCSRFE